MVLKEKISRAQMLRSQVREIELKLNRLRGELEALNTDIKSNLDATGESYKHLSEDEFQTMLSSLNDPSLVNIEVVYAMRERQVVNAIQVSRGATIEDGIRVSGILDDFSEIDIETSNVGVYGSLRKLSDIVVEGDRIEIYRPLE